MGTKRHTNHGQHKMAEQRALLAALSDDLALPLLQIKTAVELMQSDYSAAQVASQAATMAMSADVGLQLVEAYRLALMLDNERELAMEPVSIGAIMQDVAHELTPIARQYSTQLDVDVQGKLTLVLAHRASLMAALQCLGASLIRAQASQQQQEKYRLLFGAHRMPNQIIATGVFSNTENLSDQTLKAARGMMGHARQPLQSLPAGAASGVLIADILCTSMWQPLKATAHRNMTGLATGIPLTRQLSFV
jgi:light-regulated signal transduction histidine kinase (bacteriophytochrome)